MQSRGFFASRRPTDDSFRCNATTHRSNGDVIRQDYHVSVRENQQRYGRAERNHRDRSAHVYPRERTTEANYVLDRDVQPRRTRHRDYADPYEVKSIWRDWPSDLNASKLITKNGVSHGRGGERLYSSTLPRRSRTINFRDQPGYPLESRRAYPKSLQDLSDLELDETIRDPAISSYLSSSHRGWRENRSDNGYRRRRYREDQLEDDYLRLYRNLSSIEKYRQGGKYQPGQVHYERECRTFGKDTVAFIYYKTCYL